MATARLTKYYKDQIIDIIVKEALATRRIAQEKLHIELYRMLWEARLPQDIRAYIAQRPQSFDSYYEIQVYDNSILKGRVQAKTQDGDILTGKKTEDMRDRSIQASQLTVEVLKTLEVFINEGKSLSSDEGKLRTELCAALHPISTTKRLLEFWPDIETTFPAVSKYLSHAPAALPAVQRADDLKVIIDKMRHAA